MIPSSILRKKFAFTYSGCINWFARREEFQSAIRSSTVDIGIVGCDVGPAKGGACFDGDQFLLRSVNQLTQWVDNLRPRQLIAWDAPLTGPRSSESEQLGKGDLTKRLIERFFSQGEFNAPKGISVQGYAACQHWTISQRMLGLPRIGRYSATIPELPLCPLFSDHDRFRVENESKPCVVEVHPAVGMWLWCMDSFPAAEWVYKGKGANLSIVVQRFKECVPEARSLPQNVRHDQLDAYLAWLLAYKWLKEEGVILLGNEQTGAFLVPEVNRLTESFAEFEMIQQRKP